MSILKEKNKRVIELPGVMPNPTLEKLEEGASLARENNIDFINDCLDKADMLYDEGDIDKALDSYKYDEVNK